MSELLTRKESAEILNLKPHTLWFWEKRGILKPFIKVGNKPRYSIEGLAEAVTANDNKKKLKHS